MQIAAEANRRFLKTAAPQAAADWDSLLKHQVDLVFPQELEFLLSLKAWQDGSRILDAGCGNGYYMSRLQEFFPEKEYCGVDLSPELVARAASRHPALAVSVDNIVSYAPRERFDVVVMRFLVQHLRDFRAILDAADRLLRRGGRLVVIESDLARCSNFPALPIFTEMLLTFARVSAAHGAVKGRLLAAPHQLVAETDPSWSIERDECVTSPRIGPFTGSRLLAVYQLWVDLCERSGMFEFDFNTVRHELQCWADGAANFSSVALRLLVMTRLSRH
jgi:ubiquinone/menaquinone biosynthesis C-methylase UbiE